MGTGTVARRYPRIELPRGMLVAWQSAGARVVSRVGTLGLGGLFIHTAKPAPIGEVLRLIFQLPDGDIEARAMVCDSRPGRGMGVSFTSMNQESRARLNRLMKRLTQV